MTGNPIPDATLLDAVDDEHRLELVEWAEACGLPITAGTVADYLAAVNDVDSRAMPVEATPPPTFEAA